MVVDVQDISLEALAISEQIVGRTTLDGVWFPGELSDELKTVKSELTKLLEDTDYRNEHENQYLFIRGTKFSWAQIDPGCAAGATIFKYIKPPGATEFDLILWQENTVEFGYTPEFYNIASVLQTIQDSSPTPSSD